MRERLQKVIALQKALYSPVWHHASDSNVFTSTLFKLLESHFPIADVIFMLNYTKTNSCIKFELGGFISTSHNNNYIFE